MRVDVISIFPEYLAPLSLSLIGKARERGLVDLRVHDLRDGAEDAHRSVDDTPYGGGPGMVMRPEPWGRVLDEVCTGPQPSLLVVPTPSGRRLCQRDVAGYAGLAHLVIACGRYEGIDARVVEDARRRIAVDEVSIGDYVLAGGEVAALVIVEAVTRLLPGVVGNCDSVSDDSFSAGLLEGPVYTRPPSWRALQVPEVLRSGDHAAIAAWRHRQALLRTFLMRPDLLDPAALTSEDRAVLDEQLHPRGPGVAK